MRVYIIDRFEGSFAVCEEENGETIGLERARIPREAEEGDVLIHEAGVFRIDREQTARRREKMRRKLDRLWADDE